MCMYLSQRAALERLHSSVSWLLLCLVASRIDIPSLCKGRDPRRALWGRGYFHFFAATSLEICFVSSEAEQESGRLWFAKTRDFGLRC